MVCLQVTWRPWAEANTDTNTIRALYLTKRRVVFEGPRSFVYYLGERVTRQFLGRFYVPQDPPPDMYALDKTDLSVLPNLKEGVLWKERILSSGDYENVVSRHIPYPGRV
jgi:hypothetical protein